MNAKESHLLVAPRPLTKKETAAYFSVTERTIDRWLRDGTLPADARVLVGGTVRFRLPVLERVVNGVPEQ